MYEIGIDCMTAAGENRHYTESIFCTEHDMQVMYIPTLRKAMSVVGGTLLECNILSKA